MEIEPSIIAEISGRYRINENRLVEVFQNNDQLFGKQLGEEPIELIKISDSTFVRRDINRLIQFKPNSENRTMNMLILNSNDGKNVSTFAKMSDDEKIPIEFLVEGNFSQSLEAYQALMKEDAKDPTIDENNLNVLGYRFLGNERTKMAHDIFKINMILYPDSFNVYDSYAEACMIMGEVELAIKNYNKSLDLNPQNNNAKEMLKELQKI
jgi:tetratricopeptide (TPR) repeat protein